MDTMTTAAHCGGCGNVCDAGDACVAGCHSGAKPKEDLSLTMALAYDELVGVASLQCAGGDLLVKPGAPGESYPIRKLYGVDLCAGTAMPKPPESLSDAEIDLVAAWICSGALKN